MKKSVITINGYVDDGAQGLNTLLSQYMKNSNFRLGVGSNQSFSLIEDLNKQDPETAITESLKSVLNPHFDNPVVEVTRTNIVDEGSYTLEINLQVTDNGEVITGKQIQEVTNNTLKTVSDISLNGG